MTGLLAGRFTTYRRDVTLPPSLRDSRKVLAVSRPVEDPPAKTPPGIYEISVMREGPYSRHSHYPLWRDWANANAPFAHMPTKDVAMYVQNLGEDCVEAVLISLGGQLVPEQLRNLLCIKSFDLLPEDVRDVVRFGARWYWPVRFGYQHSSVADYLYGDASTATGRHHKL